MENLRLEYLTDWELDLEKERRRREEEWGCEQSQCHVYYKQDDKGVTTQILTLYPNNLRVYDMIFQRFLNIPISSNNERLVIFNMLGISFSDFKKNK